MSTCATRRQIHESFGPLAPSRMYSRGGDGPSVCFVPCATEDATAAADDVVEEFLDAAGRRAASAC